MFPFSPEFLFRRQLMAGSCANGVDSSLRTLPLSREQRWGECFKAIGMLGIGNAAFRLLGAFAIWRPTD